MTSKNFHFTKRQSKLDRWDIIEMLFTDSERTGSVHPSGLLDARRSCRLHSYSLPWPASAVCSHTCKLDASIHHERLCRWSYTRPAEERRRWCRWIAGDRRTLTTGPIHHCSMAHNWAHSTEEYIYDNRDRGIEWPHKWHDASFLRTRKNDQFVTESNPTKTVTPLVLSDEWSIVPPVPSA